MKFCKSLLNLILIFLIVFTPEAQAVLSEKSIPIVPEVLPKQLLEKSDNLVSLEYMLQLIDYLENDDLLGDSLNEEELERVNQFIFKLAANGANDNDEEEMLALRRDIKDLSHQDYDDLCLNLTDPNYRVIVPAIFNEHPEYVLCKSWLSNSWKSTRKFIKKHKKAIIVGAVVVVAVAVAIYVAVTKSGDSSSSESFSEGSTLGESAVGAAAAAVATVAAKKNKEKEPKSFINEDILVEGSEAQELFYDSISSLKESISEDESIGEFIQEEDALSDAFLLEQLQTLGSGLAHEIVDCVSEMTAVAPKLAEEIEAIGEMILPEGMLEVGRLEQLSGPGKNFEDAVANGHELIDKVFGTDLAENFTAEAKADAYNEELVIGFLPPPGGIPKLFSNTNKLVKAGNVLDRARFTRVGRGLMKHGYRKGSHFPKPLGNPAQINKQGESILKEILNDPKRTILKNNRGGIEIYAPNGRGAYFKEDGTFRGFIEHGHK